MCICSGDFEKKKIQKRFEKKYTREISATT